MTENNMRAGKHEYRPSAAERTRDRSYITWLLSKIGAVICAIAAIWAVVCLMGLGDRTYMGDINPIHIVLLVGMAIVGVRLNKSFRRRAKRAAKTYNASERYLQASGTGTCPRTGV